MLLRGERYKYIDVDTNSYKLYDSFLKNAPENFGNKSSIAEKTIKNCLNNS
jgi:hypothetical protein